MVWRHPVAVVLLIALAGLPVGGTVCAALCHAPSTAIDARHDSGLQCSELASPSSGSQVASASRHCDTRPAAILQIATIVVERTDPGAVSGPRVGAVRGALVILDDTRAVLAAAGPPRSDRPPTLARVLRI